MPWTAKDAHGKTHKANTPVAQRQWKDVANSMLKSGKSDKAAIMAANAVVGRRKKSNAEVLYPKGK